MLESGEPREVHHFATLIGYGASAINPYLLFDTVDELVAEGRIPGVDDPDEAEQQRRQGDRQGPAQDDLQDGDLDDPVLLRRADLRGGRPRAGADRPPLHRHRVADRRHRRSRCSPRRRSTATPAPTRASRRRPAAGRRRLRVAPRRRAAHVEPRDDRAAPARRAVAERRRAGEVRRVRADGQRRGRARGDAARAAASSAPTAPSRSRSTRSSRPRRSSSASPPARCRSARSRREAHETLAIAMNRLGGRSNTGEGGEDPRALRARRQRRPAPLGDQAGRLGALRRDDPLPRQRRPAADQDGPGRQARRGRPAARPQGRPATSAGSATRRRASGLISPPPHHDIYSIEDLKQLIYDLRCSNPRAQRLGEARRRGRASARSPPASPRPTPTTS